MWLRNLQIYKLTRFDLSYTQLAESLADHPLTSPTGMELQRAGWLSPTGDNQPIVHQYGEQLLIALGVDKKLLPASVINRFAKERAQEVEEQQGYKPGRKQMKQIKEAITDELLPRSFVQRRITRAWIDPVNMRLVIDASSVSRADDVVSAILQCVEGIAFQPLRTSISPLGGMTDWMLSGPPFGFTLDDSCELRSTGSAGSVRYTSNAPDHEEVRKHIESGKATAKLAMTWNDRISFVLDEAMQIKRVKPLDVLTEQTYSCDDAFDADFDADFALMTGEVAQMVGDLVEALGGEEGQ